MSEVMPQRSRTLLLIEDDDLKRQSVLNVLNKEYPEVAVTTCNSVRKAIDTLTSLEFDVVLADMSLPTFDIEIRERGGTPRPFGGIEVFEELERLGNTVPVLVVTSYPVLSDGKKSVSYKDLEDQLKRDFPDNFIGLVYFDSALTDWERDLRKCLSQVFK